MCRKLIALFLLLVLAACQDGSFLSFGPKATPFPEQFNQSLQVGDLKVSILCQGSGDQTILLENGNDFTVWGKDSLDRFSKISRVCLHIRPGMEGETISIRRTALDQVNDLHDLLKKAGVPGPYILVSHYTGGFNALIFAAQFPDEVAGMVCVNCIHPIMFQDWYVKFKEISATGSSQAMTSYTLLQTCMDEKTWKTGWENPENIDVCASYFQAAELTSLGDLPLVVLMAGGPLGWFAKDLDTIFYETWLNASKNFIKTTTHSRLEVVPDTNLYSLAASDSVEKAVLEVYEGVINE